MAKVELKQPIVQEISETIKDAQSLVVVDYRGLTVAEDTQLRKNLREAGVTYKVYKNTLVNRAIEGTEFESLKDVLEGPTTHLQYLQKMLQLQPEFWQSSQRRLQALRSRPAL